ncbi:MAG: shikimate dehydrogenase [Candidatus Omnitrophica bacterium]|nr:shikimate dehydrogenase [Candidatus Omnitrophota bacterium]MDE2009109.1 shikimate dehydrogenase [Candidatus Omnitrophota bacterium]MDE2214226.1 shikimate dehydrogenase [Candidatus Omnitrophota bacterium]MDE2231263.1 shikimate dehydrogenase [Candidatus Omnitrophota bacterium]
MNYEPPAIYGIIGNPVERSLSPVMHNTAFKALKVNAVYKLFPLADAQDLKLFMEDLKEQDNPVFGLNVTVPYKEDVLPYLDSVDALADKIGAVNTIVIDHQRKLHGFNTDGPGFMSHLTELGFDFKGKRLAVLGAGGTARAIISVLCLLPEGPESIAVYNRTRGNADVLLEDLRQKIPVEKVRIVDEPEDLNIELADLLINTTNVGMKDSEALLIDAGALHKDMLVYDVIYNPQETKLLKEARARGARTSNGLGMLFFQGMLAFWHWSDVELDEEIKKIVRKSLGEASLRHGS